MLTWIADAICRGYGGVAIQTPHPLSAERAFRREAALAEGRLLAAWTAWNASPPGGLDGAAYQALTGAADALLALEAQAFAAAIPVGPWCEETQVALWRLSRRRLP